MPWQRSMYNLIYRRGTPRWDTGTAPPELEELIEGEHAVRPGRALDLGCGTGTHVVYLAQHGWDAVGIDFSAVAIRAAQARVDQARGMSFVEGDVTKLSACNVEGPFDLVLDVGCFHGIPSTRRSAYIDGVVRVTRPGALLVLWAIDSERRTLAPGAPSASESEMRRRFEPRFAIQSARPGDMIGQESGQLPWSAKWYVMVRQPSATV